MGRRDRFSSLNVKSRCCNRGRTKPPKRMNKTVFEIKVERLMRQNRLRAPRRRRNSGAIDSKRLPRYLTSSKVFKKRGLEKKGSDYSVVVLLDASGSMEGQKAVLCAQAGQKLAESLEKIPGITYEVVIFNSMDLIVKPFDLTLEQAGKNGIEEMYEHMHEKAYVNYVYNKKKNYFNITLQGHYKFAEGDKVVYSESANSNNMDSIFVLKACERLMARKGRKVLIVMSDGQPTIAPGVRRHLQNFSKANPRGVISGSKEAVGLFEQTGFSPVDSLKKVVDKKSRKVDILGIGILTDYVKSFYPHQQIIWKVNDLYPQTLKGLARLFIKD